MKHEIIVEYVQPDKRVMPNFAYRAHIKGELTSQGCGVGPSRSSAIGDLVCSHPEKFNVTVELVEPITFEI